MQTTMKHLKGIIDRLNQVTGSPAEYSTDRKTNVGHFCLDQAYGGYSLNRISNEAGGVSSHYCYGRHTKSGLYDRIAAMIQGIEFN